MPVQFIDKYKVVAGQSTNDHRVTSSIRCQLVGLESSRAFDVYSQAVPILSLDSGENSTIGLGVLLRKLVPECHGTKNAFFSHLLIHCVVNRFGLLFPLKGGIRQVFGTEIASVLSERRSSACDIHEGFHSFESPVVE